MPEPDFQLVLEVTVKDENGGRPEDWYYASVRYVKDIPSPEMLGVSAAQRALQKIGQKKIKSGVYNHAC
jgi:PmbA protein